MRVKRGMIERVVSNNDFIVVIRINCSLSSVEIAILDVDVAFSIRIIHAHRGWR
jgi:hypothetical protein